MKNPKLILYLFLLTIIPISSSYSKKQNYSSDNNDSLNVVNNLPDSVSPCWSKLADLITPRQVHMIAVHENKVYVAGGYTGGRKFEEYNVDIDTWKSLAEMPTPRTYISGCTLNGKIYAIGGLKSTQPYETYAIVEEYDPKTGSWTTKSSMPSQRWGHSSVVLENKIYVVGGALDWPISKYYTSIEIYDPESDTWTTKKGPVRNGIAPRWGFSACVANGKIYAIGGIDVRDYPEQGNAVQSMAIVEEYDPATNSWVRKASMPTPRWCLSAVTVNNKIYAIGGGDTFFPEKLLSIVEEYDPLNDTWVTKSPMPKGEIAPSACALNNLIYITGGGGFSPYDTYSNLFVYNPECDMLKK